MHHYITSGYPYKTNFGHENFENDSTAHHHSAVLWQVCALVLLSVGGARPDHCCDERRRGGDGRALLPALCSCDATPQLADRMADPRPDAEGMSWVAGRRG